MSTNQPTLADRLVWEDLVTLREYDGRWRIEFENGRTRTTAVSAIAWVAETDPAATVTPIDVDEE